jgi:hypothetical protein
MSNEIPIYGLPHRKLKEVKEDKNNKNKEVVLKAADKKDNRNGIAEIERNQPAEIERNQTHSANNEDMGRDDAESIVTPSVENSDNILESGPAGDSSEDANVEAPEVEFDKTKFVAGERLLPIVFNMTVSKYTNTINHDALKTHFKDFIEDVLDMKSNLDWYPYHSKSMHNISIQLIPSDTLTEGINEEQSVDHTISVQMIINGLVFVHVNEQGVGIVTSTTRKAGGAKQQPEDVNDSAIRSIFHDSFDHSMLLYFTFWGVENLQEALEEDGGVQKPVIDSIIVGKKHLITFQVDKDDNHLYNGDHDSFKPKHSISKVISAVGNDSSARASKYGLYTFIMISATTTSLIAAVL